MVSSRRSSEKMLDVEVSPHVHAVCVLWVWVYLHTVHTCVCIRVSMYVC